MNNLSGSPAVTLVRSFRPFLATTIVSIVVMYCCSASAAPIKFILEGSGVGSIAGVPFEDSAFTITSIGNNDDRYSYSAGFWIDHLMSRIEIQGVGTFNVVTTTRTFVNNVEALVGYSLKTNIADDLFYAPSDNGFKTWQMLNSFGPIEGTGALFQWPEDAVQTDAGVLMFFYKDISATFQAIVLDSRAPGDTNFDGQVDLEDLNNVRNGFGRTGLGDTDDDNDVDLDDLNAVRNNFGAGEASLVPEPSSVSLALLALGVMGIVERRRRKTR